MFFITFDLWTLLLRTIGISNAVLCYYSAEWKLVAQYHGHPGVIRLARCDASRLGHLGAQRRGHDDDKKEFLFLFMPVRGTRLSLNPKKALSFVDVEALMCVHASPSLTRHSTAAWPTVNNTQQKCKEDGFGGAPRSVGSSKKKEKNKITGSLARI